MELISLSDVVISDGYPSIDTNGDLLVFFVIKYDESNTLCASGTSKRRKRQVTLTTSELLLPRSTLLTLIQAQ